MNDSYSFAKYWKCALQVNPYSYLAYRGDPQTLTEEAYNKQLLDVCLEEKINVLGIADHGNVDGVDAIRTLVGPHGITVFPGFEIASSEKIHFVCLFPETTSKDVLNRYLGNLDLLDPENGVRPSKLSAEQLIAKVMNELGGVIYAAHCTDDSGLLKGRFNHVWKNEQLLACQIPGSIEDLKGIEEDFYRKVILNKNQDYKRERDIAILNAKDVEKPETLRNPKATCWIKMTKPCFESFRQAFKDPQSRIVLNSDLPENHASAIESLSITGGYLDGLYIDFSEHLNTVIGGRGTGKSTLLECIRYALGITPLGKEAQKIHDSIIKENLGGRVKGRIELKIRSSAMNGNRYTVSRKYGESSFVIDKNGESSSFTPRDILPTIEIYGQNEIYEVAQDTEGQLRLLNRFLDVDSKESHGKLSEIHQKLISNRKSITDAIAKKAQIEDEVAKLPKLLEQAEQYKSLGLEEKLKVVPLIEKEKQLSQRVQTEIKNLVTAISVFKESLPDTVFLSDKALEGLPHESQLKEIRTVFDSLKTKLDANIARISSDILDAQKEIGSAVGILSSAISVADEELLKVFKDIPACEGKTGKEIGSQFKLILEQIERIRPQETQLKQHEQYIAELKKLRRGILNELSELRTSHASRFMQAIKRLNRKLDKKLRLNLNAESNRTPLIQLLGTFNLEGVGEKRLAWIETAEDFSSVALADAIRNGTEFLKNNNWGITTTVADALSRLNESQLMQIEEVTFPDNISIELNVAHDGTESYRPLDRLSTGQKCTAILHLLLLENKDPLIMDQPEDNLDNAFIADRIVAELRSAKIGRQFLFATHNANIPVFGDAEWIGVFEVENEHGVIPAHMQGAIDIESIQSKASEILEGGKKAFKQRQEKYGF